MRTTATPLPRHAQSRPRRFFATATSHFAAAVSLFASGGRGLLCGSVSFALVHIKDEIPERECLEQGDVRGGMGGEMHEGMHVDMRSDMWGHARSHV